MIVRQSRGTSISISNFVVYNFPIACRLLDLIPPSNRYRLTIVHPVHIAHARRVIEKTTIKIPGKHASKQEPLAVQ